MSKRRIVVPDLRIGNMASVANMVRKCGGHAEIVTDPAGVTRDCKIILAGVGSFDAAMSGAVAGGWPEVLNDIAAEGAPILGICLGMQLMCASSEEGDHAGLGWIDAEVRRFRPPPGSSLKSPHMGWNTVKVVRPNPLIPSDNGEQRFYFVHSYYVACHRPEDVVATATHGEEFTAAFARGNLFGVQFHPEKSHRFGMALIKKFVDS